MKRMLFVLLLLGSAWNLPAQRFTLFDIDTTGGSNAFNLMEYDGMIYLSASDAAHGDEMWVSDGTPEGTHLFMDIAPGPDGSYYTGPEYIYNGNLIFTAYTTATGAELWITDGTVAGTSIIKDIEPGDNFLPSYTSNLAELDGKLYFIASDGTNGSALWETNGTEAGTVMVKDMDTLSTTGFMRSFLVVFEGKIYFVADDGVHGEELWITDGTAPGTVMLMDIYPGATGTTSPSLPGYVGLTPSDGNLYFMANTPADGYEPWVITGDGVAPTILKDIKPGAGSSQPEAFYEFQGQTFFFASDTARSLWKTDGTPASTTEVVVIDADTMPQYNYFEEFKGYLYFANTNSVHGEEVWRTDGTAGGTMLVVDVVPGADGSEPYNFTSCGGGLYFFAFDNADLHLWQSDGTAANTTKLVPAGSTAPSPIGINDYFYCLRNAIYYSAEYFDEGRELWRYEDTTAVGVSTVLPAASLQVYPNPNTGTFTVSLQQMPLAGAVVIITDMSGRIVATEQLTGKETTLNTNSLSRGMYLVTIGGDLHYWPVKKVVVY